MARIGLVLGIILSAAIGAEAAVRVEPLNPTMSDQITAFIDVTGVCDASISTVVTGSSIRTDVRLIDCFPGPPPFTVVRAAVFGPLPPGTYTYSVYILPPDEAPILEHEQAIVVAPAAIAVPALNDLSRWGLVLTIAVVALLALKRL